MEADAEVMSKPFLLKVGRPAVMKTFADPSPKQSRPAETSTVFMESPAAGSQAHGAQVYNLYTTHDFKSHALSHATCPALLGYVHSPAPFIRYSAFGKLALLINATHTANRLTPRTP